MERRLWCAEGFAWLHGPGLWGHRAQESFGLWCAAEERAVAPLYAVRTMGSGRPGRRCVTYLFWTGSPPAEICMAEYVLAAEGVDPQALRRAAGSYSSLSRWQAVGRSTLSSQGNADGLNDPASGRYAVTVTEPVDAPERSLVVWARVGDVDYVHPIRGDLTC